MCEIIKRIRQQSRSNSKIGIKKLHLVACFKKKMHFKLKTYIENEQFRDIRDLVKILIFNFLKVG